MKPYKPFKRSRRKLQKVTSWEPLMKLRRQPMPLLMLLKKHTFMPLMNSKKVPMLMQLLQKKLLQMNLKQLRNRSKKKLLPLQILLQQKVKRPLSQ